MILSKKLRPLALATSIAVTGLAAPMVSQAEVGYSLALSSMNLWRGMGTAEPAVSGSIDYANESGFYASLWLTSTVGSSYEVDPIIGFAGEAGDFAYDLSYYAMWAPMPDVDFSDAVKEFLASVSYDAFSASVAISDDDYYYYTLGAGFDAFSFTYGLWDADGGADYSHFDVSYAATDSLSFTLSLPSDSGYGVADDPLMMISYSVPLE